MSADEEITAAPGENDFVCWGGDPGVAESFMSYCLNKYNPMTQKNAGPVREAHDEYTLG